MSYAESKKKIDAIRQEYGCKGEVLFRTAIQNVIDYGKCTLLDPGWYEPTIDEIEWRHDKAEAEGKWLLMTREFEKAIVDCSVALCEINTYDLLTYIQREVWLGGGEVGEPDYQRAMEIIRDCLSYMAGCYNAYTYDNEEILEKFRCVMEDHEIEFFGWEELFEDEVLEE
jgi:hypothetical protein